MPNVIGRWRVAIWTPTTARVIPIVLLLVCGGASGVLQIEDPCPADYYRDSGLDFENSLLPPNLDRASLLQARVLSDRLHVVVLGKEDKVFRVYNAASGAEVYAATGFAGVSLQVPFDSSHIYMAVQPVAGSAHYASWVDVIAYDAATGQASHWSAAGKSTEGHRVSGCVESGVAGQLVCAFVGFADGEACGETFTDCYRGGGTRFFEVSVSARGQAVEWEHPPSSTNLFYNHYNSRVYSSLYKPRAGGGQRSVVYELQLVAATGLLEAGAAPSVSFDLDSAYGVSGNPKSRLRVFVGKN